jgi:mannose-6-phosphate isomerase
MGAHPKAPSAALVHGEWQPLDALIRSAPKRLLGQRVQQRFGQLPFLFKVLAAQEPLSLQAHPNKQQAEAGYAAEDQHGLSLSAPERNYKDRNHKPELICALSPFEALCGFRNRDEARSLFAALGNPELESFTDPLSSSLSDEEAVKQTFTQLLRAPKATQATLVASTSSCLQRRPERTPFEAAFAWAQTLANSYPGDVGVITSLLLNHVSLAPGEALYLPAGNLHAYLGGLGLELMANSDNVLRGGLTPKHVDVDELLRVLRFETGPAEIRTPSLEAEGQWVYRTEAAEFELWKLELGPKPVAVKGSDGPEIILATSGKAIYQTSRHFVELLPGESAFINSKTKPYQLTGRGTVYRALVPSDRISAS